MSHPRCVKIGESRYDIYIGRPRVGAHWGYGNPFEIGVDGTRAEVIAKFRDWLRTGENAGNGKATEERRQWILTHLEEVAEKTVLLGCFCGSNLRCHGDELIALADEMAAKEHGIE